MEGPSKAEIAFEDRKDGSCGVSYVVQEPGRRSQLGGEWAAPATLIDPGFLFADQTKGCLGLRTFPHQPLSPFHPKSLQLLRAEPRFNEFALG